MKTLGKIILILLLIALGIATFTGATTLLTLPSTIANICGGVLLLFILFIIYGIYKIITLNGRETNSLDK